MNGRKGSASLTLPTAENSLFIGVGSLFCTPASWNVVTGNVLTLVIAPQPLISTAIRGTRELVGLTCLLSNASENESAVASCELNWINIVRPSRIHDEMKWNSSLTFSYVFLTFINEPFRTMRNLSNIKLYIVALLHIYASIVKYQNLVTPF